MSTDVLSRTSVSVSLQINTLKELEDFCGVLSKTDMVPKAYKDKPGDILVAMLHGQEVGLPHLQALQCIAVVNGIPSIYGDAALAMVRASGKLEDFDEWIEVDGKRQDGPFPIIKWAEEGKSIVAFCRSKRVGMSRERVTTFSVDDAQRAKLWMKKGHNGYETPWCTVPQRMLMWRARGWNLRDNFGDVLKGLSIYEEAMDIETERDGNGVYRPMALIEESKEKVADVRERLRESNGHGTAKEQPKDTQQESQKEPSKDTTMDPDKDPTQKAKGPVPTDALPFDVTNDTKWETFILYMSDDPERFALLKTVREKFHTKSAKSIAAKDRPAFVHTLLDCAKQEKIALVLKF